MKDENLYERLADHFDHFIVGAPRTDTKKRLGFNALALSSCLANVDAKSCTACGECLARCPMAAISQPDGGPVAVVEERCIGCGLCSARCPEKAVTLRLRQPANHPPDAATFLERKLG